MIFYKLVKELKKTHSNGIIHNDLKLGNILINSIGPNFKMFETQLIDWNLASFYYLGY
jgi:serine/threonine protein kinase